MPEKRPTHIRIQNWKKTIAGAVVICLNLFALAQNSPFSEYNFFDNRNGLPTHITRKTRVDSNGTAWIATDAGISIIPENSKIHRAIIDRVGPIPVWDIYFHQGLTYIGTYDSQILVFNQSNGKFNRKILFDRFRRFREINHKLFAVGSTGVAEISTPKPRYWFLTQNTPSKATAMDIEYWNQTYFILQYGIGNVFSSKNGIQWQKDQSLIGKELSKCNLVATTLKTVKNQLFVGLESNQYKIFFNWNSCDSVIFARRPEKSYCIWDIDSDQDKAYFSAGNHLNFDEGSILIHHLDKKHQDHPANFIDLPFIWGITVDTLNDGLWLNSIVAGASFLPDLGKRIPTPVEFQGFLTSENSTIGWKNNVVYLLKNGVWTSHELPVNIKKCFSLADESIWIHAEKGVFRLFNSTLSLISPKHYHFAEMVGNQLYVCEYFYQVNAINTKTLIVTENIHPKLKSIITLKTINNQLLAQTESNGYYIINHLKAKSVTLDHAKPKAKNNFYYSGNLLITENGKELIFYEYSKKDSNFQSIYKIDISEFFFNQKIDWIETNIHGIWVFTNNTIIQLAFKNPKNGLQMIGQYYLGRRAQVKNRVRLTSRGIYVLSESSIDFIPLNVKNQCSFNSKININLENYQFFASSIAGRVWQGSNFQLNLNTEKFNQHQNGYIQIELINEQGKIVQQSIYPNNTPVWFNDLPAGIYQIRMFNGQSEKNLVFRINMTLFRVPAFWIILFLGIGLLVFVLIFNQKERFNLTEKLLSMELATLKNNMNPHFIFNTMNLIQSLIVRANVKQALKATSELAKLNRLFLETSNKDFVPLSEEIDYAKKYVGLEQMRFESDHLFQFQIFIDENLNINSWFIPPLILQPLLENAIKHGALMSQNTSNISLNLDLASPHLLIITVKNELNSKRKPRPGTQIGLKLVRDRLNLIQRKYPNLYEFNLNIEPSKTFFTVSISIKRLDQTWIYE